MTDTNQTQSTESPFQPGEKASILRGRNAGQLVEILHVHGEQAAVKLPDGSMTVVNSASLREPEPAKILVRDLADALTSANMPAGDGATARVLAELERLAPGITEAVGVVH